MKRFSLIGGIMAIATALSAAAAELPLQFGKDGKIRIVQFTDTHYQAKHKGKSRPAVECIEAVLDAEHPDLVVFTGDLVYSDRAKEGIDSVLRPVVERGLPFAFTFGNHDTEFDLTHAEFYDYIAAKPGSLMPPRNGAESPDYVIEIASAADSSKAAAALYCLDSHRGAQVADVGGYAWIEQPQIEWYRQQSDSLSRLPALMFFHIPVPEFDYAYTALPDKVVGEKLEAVCCPKLNSGLFCAIEEQGDVRGVFCGHDHDNDYVVPYFGVLLAYGRYSGGNTVYNNLHPNGARVIEFSEPTGSVTTYIRLSNGDVLYPYTHEARK